jgi:hypothetical protein
MITAVNASSVSSASSAAQADKPDAEQIFKTLDTGSKGYLTVDDLQAAVVKISAEGARQADATGKAAPSAEGMLAKMDGDGDGKVTLDEFKAAEPKGPAPGAAQGGGGAVANSQGGRGGQGQVVAAGGQSGGAASSASATTQAYEPADTNEDGQVSAKEQAAYDAKLAAQKADAQAGSSRNAEADAAVRAYESVDQLSKAAPAA